MTFLIIVIAVDLRDFFFKALTIALLLFLAFYGLSGISLRYNRATISSFLFGSVSLTSSSFLFLFGFFLSLLGLSFLFGLVSLIFTLILGGCAKFKSLFRLIVAGFFH